MITPAFGLTATERVLPKLALDFTTASLDPRVTFTRTTGAANPATYVGSNGYIASATNNQPRFDYDPTTLACKGLLIEESRANLCLQSQDLTTTWLTNLPGCVTANVAVSPDGTQNADQIVLTGGSFQYVYQNITVTSGQTYTFSFYVKAATPGNTPFRAYGDYTGGSATALTPTQSWVRQTITFTAADTTATLAFAVPSTGAAVSIYIWGTQLELGAFATSYIPTTTTALTRNADVAVMTGTNFSNWYNAGSGAFGCAVLPKSATGTKPVLQFDDTTVLNTITIQGNATAVELKITTLAVLQSTLSTGTITANTAYGSCGAWTAGSNALSKSGGVATTGSPVSIPTVTQSRLGSDGTNYFNGWLQKINYWPQRLTNNEVQAFSK